MSDEKTAKAIIVVEVSGRQRSYAAEDWGTTAEGRLTVTRNRLAVALYSEHAWLSVREDSALADDIKPKADRMQSALRRIAMAEGPMTVDILQRIARECLESTGWDEDDL